MRNTTGSQQINDCENCHNLTRKGAESPYFCYAKPSRPTRKCECFYPLSALTATIHIIERTKNTRPLNEQKTIKKKRR